MKDTQSRTILLVEDEVIVALAEQRLLEMHGYTVQLANNGRSAVESVRDDPDIDLVLMDIDLGAGMDGTAAARQILAIRQLPIVFLTSHAEQEYVHAVKEITRYGYVLKSSGEFVLIEAITSAFELREKEERLTTAERLGNLGGWEVDLVTGKTYWSDQFYRICGLEPGSEEPSTELGMSLIHPEDRPKAQAALARALDTGGSYDIQKRIQWRDGTVRYVHSVGEVRSDKSGRRVAIIGSFLDITETVEARREAERAQAQFAAFMSHFPGAAFLKNQRNELIYCNSRYAAMLNAEPEALLGTAPNEDLPPALREQYERENRWVVEERKVLTAESTFGDPENETKWLTYKFPVEVLGEVLVGGISLEMAEHNRDGSRSNR